MLELAHKPLRLPPLSDFVFFTRVFFSMMSFKMKIHCKCKCCPALTAQRAYSVRAARQPGRDRFTFTCRQGQSALLLLSLSLPLYMDQTTTPFAALALPPLHAVCFIRDKWNFNQFCHLFLLSAKLDSLHLPRHFEHFWGRRVINSSNSSNLAILGEEGRQFTIIRIE